MNDVRFYARAAGILLLAGTVFVAMFVFTGLTLLMAAGYLMFSLTLLLFGHIATPQEVWDLWSNADGAGLPPWLIITTWSFDLGVFAFVAWLGRNDR